MAERAGPMHTTTPPRLASLRLFVRDCVAARDFYRDQIGLPLTADGSSQGWCTFDIGGVQLVVEAVGPDAPEDEQVLVGRFTGASFGAADIHAAYAELKQRGVFFAGPPEQQAWGGWLATFEDPAGNGLQLVQFPSREGT